MQFDAENFRARSLFSLRIGERRPVYVQARARVARGPVEPGRRAELRAGPPEATRVRPRRAAGGVRRTVEPAAWWQPRGFVTVSRPSLGVLTGKAYQVGSGSTWQTGGGAQCWVDGGVYALVFSCTTPSRVQLRRRLREPLPGQTTSKILCVFISEDGL